MNYYSIGLCKKLTPIYHAGYDLCIKQVTMDNSNIIIFFIWPPLNPGTISWSLK